MGESLSSDTVVGIVSQGGEGRKWFIGLTAVAAGVTVVGLGLALLAPVLFPPSPAVRARKLMRLPVEAKVLSVRDGADTGEGDVWFSLPPTTSVEAWEDTVWALNGDPPAGPSPKTLATPVVAKTPLPGGKHKLRAAPSAPPATRAAYVPYVAYRSGLKLKYSNGAGGRTGLDYDAKSGRYHYWYHEIATPAE